MIDRNSKPFGILLTFSLRIHNRSCYASLLPKDQEGGERNAEGQICGQDGREAREDAWGRWWWRRRGTVVVTGGFFARDTERTDPVNPEGQNGTRCPPPPTLTAATWIWGTPGSRFPDSYVLLPIDLNPCTVHRRVCLQKADEGTLFHAPLGDAEKWHYRSPRIHQCNHAAYSWMQKHSCKQNKKYILYIIYIW